MAREYNIIERLKRRNEKPTVVLDDEHKYPINTKKTNVLCMMAYIRKTEKRGKEESDPVKDMEMMDHIIKMGLGEEAAAYIAEQDYTFAVVQDIIEVIMAAIGDEDTGFEKEEKTEKKVTDHWYDIFEDWDLIEASFAMQYPSKDLFAVGDDDMEWREFVTLLSGIMPETPLGQIIKIRSEDDDDILQHFTPEQHRIRNIWRNRQMQQVLKQSNKNEVMKQMKAMFKSMAA